MSEEIKSHHLRALACDIEDCHNPQSWADYCRAAANRIDTQAAEITRLRAALATARREGMEHVLTRLLWHQHDRCSGWRELRAFDQALEIIRKEIDAIRAAAQEVKP